MSTGVTMPRATREESERTAENILRVATAQFRAHGYGGTDLESIAAEAGVTRGAVYHHYANKRALFETVVLRIHSQVQAQIEQTASQYEDVWTQLEFGCAAFLDAALDPDVRTILLVEAPAVLGQEAWERMDRATSFASLTEIMRDLEQSGAIRPGSADANAHLLSGAMNAAALWLASAPDTELARDQVMRSLRAMVNALRNPPTATG